MTDKIPRDLFDDVHAGHERYISFIPASETSHRYAVVVHAQMSLSLSRVPPPGQ